MRSDGFELLLDEGGQKVCKFLENGSTSANFQEADLKAIRLDLCRAVAGVLRLERIAEINRHIIGDVNTDEKQYSAIGESETLVQ